VTDWPIARLGDHVRVKHGFAFQGEHFSDRGKLIVLTPGNFIETGGFKPKSGTEKYFTAVPPSEYVLNRGDLVIAMTEQSQGLLGSSAVIPADDIYLHNQRIGLVERTSDEADPRFLYYLFNTRQVRDQIQATATGAKVRHTAPGRVEDVRVSFPPLPIQHKIAAVLSAYDDLIENNNRRIKILEEMAQRIYREWFVDYRYPGHEDVPLVDSELGPMPVGWSWSTLHDLAEETRVGVDPASVDPDTPYIGLEHMPEHSIAISEWGVAGQAASRKYEYKRGQILFGKIRPYFHKVVVPPVDGLCSTDAIVISSRADAYWGLIVGVASSDAFVAEAVQTSQGTKMPRANWSVLKSFPVAVPQDSLLNTFNTYMKQTVGLIHGLVMAGRNLRATRDLLLPRVVSGDVDVTDLRIPVPELAA
jgi:type I restriction enzyme S subunit